MTGSAPVTEMSVGTASRVVRNSSRAPAPNSAAEPTRPSGETPSGLRPFALFNAGGLNRPIISRPPNETQAQPRLRRAQVAALAQRNAAKGWVRFMVL